jgi:hypothetical protein
MNYGDIILFPLWLILLNFFFGKIRNTYKDPLLRKYHKQAFWVKMIGCVAFFIYSGILAPADSIGLFQREGNQIYQLILHDAENVKWLFRSGKDFDLTLLKENLNGPYYQSEANFMVIRLDAIFSFITFGRYSAISLIFAAIAFSGLWKLFLFFYSQYPKMHRQFAMAILFFPTVVFWSGGVMKDTICIAALGWITHALYELLYLKKSILKNCILLFVFGYLLVIIKVYILLAYVPFFLLFIILKKIHGVRNTILKFVLAPVLITATIFAFMQVLNSYDKELGGYAMEDVTTTITTLNSAMAQRNGADDAASNFKLGADFDGSYSGLIKMAPYAIGATFFRPFIWEAHKLSQLMAALESLVLIFFTLFTLFKGGFKIFIKLILTDPLIMYCFLFSIVFALFVGTSTINFGTLVRYKIPCMPFYAISLFLIYDKVKQRSVLKTFKKANSITANAISLNPVMS